MVLRFGEPGVEHQFDHAEHAVHRRADLVAHVGEELGLGAVGRFRCHLGPQQFLLRGPDVEGHAQGNDGGSQEYQEQHAHDRVGSILRLGERRAGELALELEQGVHLIVHGVKAAVRRGHQGGGPGIIMCSHIDHICDHFMIGRHFFGSRLQQLSFFLAYRARLAEFVEGGRCLGEIVSDLPAQLLQISAGKTGAGPGQQAVDACIRRHRVPADFLGPLIGGEAHLVDVVQRGLLSAHPAVGGNRQHRKQGQDDQRRQVKFGPEAQVVD